MGEISEQVLIAEVERRLTRRYTQIPPETVSLAVRTAHARFEQSPIRDFIPLLVERQAGAQLTKVGEPATA